MAVTVPNATLARFRAFIEATKVLRPSVDGRTHASDETTLQAFTDFIERATPLLLKDIRQCLVEHRAEVDHLASWLIPCGYDLLSVTGLAGSEDPYTELIAWMLHPPDQSTVARHCQRALLASLGIDGTKLVEPVDPHTQFDTGISRPDLVLHFGQLGFVLVVEAKTCSQEHETPDGVMQCRAYPRHVRNKLRLDDDYPVKVVYLTPDGAQAEDSAAISITYLDLVRTFGLALRPDDMPDNLRWCYATIFTHFLVCATPGVDVADAIRRVSGTSNTSKKPLDNRAILSNVGGFGALARLFQREMTA